MSKDKKTGSSFGDKCLTALVGLVAACAGIYMSPVIVKAAIIAAVLLVVVTWSVSKASGLTVPELLGLLLGKALVAGFKGAAIGLVEWPLRAGHRAAARFEVRLRAQLAAARAAYRCWDLSGHLVRGVAARSNRTIAVEAARAAGALVLVVTNRITRRPELPVESVRETA